MVGESLPIHRTHSLLFIFVDFVYFVVKKSFPALNRNFRIPPVGTPATLSGTADNGDMQFQILSLKSSTTRRSTPSDIAKRTNYLGESRGIDKPDQFVPYPSS